MPTTWCERPVAGRVAAEGGGPATAGRARETRPAPERNEEPDRGPDARGGVRILGLCLSTAPLVAGSVVGAEDVGHPNGAPAQAQGRVPALAFPAGGAGDRGDQSDPRCQ